MALHSPPPERREASDPVWLMQYPSWAGMDDAYHRSNSLRQIGERGTIPQLIVSRLRPAYRAMLSARLALLPPTVQYIGLHVRHGDKVNEYPLVSFDKYMEQVEVISSSYQIRDIYLATDDDTIVKEQLVRWPHLHFVTQDMHRSGPLDSGWWGEGQASALDLFLSTMVDLVKLTQSTIFLGTQNSGFTAVVNNLRQGVQIFSDQAMSAAGDLVGGMDSRVIFDD
jgi:hypothetical protein